MADRMMTTHDFNRAHRHAIFQNVFSTFRWSNPDLLSFYEVTKLIKPEAEAYKGMKTIPVRNIIGSENRYHDFSSAFYPKNVRLQHRWESVDAANLDDIILPPISVYKLGDWYFVRDGNHRVSAARPKGVEFLGVSFDTDLEALVAYGIENQIPWMQVCNQVKWKENPISIAFDLKWIPTMFLIDPEGKVAGIAFTAEEMETILNGRSDI